MCIYERFSIICNSLYPFPDFHAYIFIPYTPSPLHLYSSDVTFPRVCVILFAAYNRVDRLRHNKMQPAAAETRGLFTSTRTDCIVHQLPKKLRASILPTRGMCTYIYRIYV